MIECKDCIKGLFGDCTLRHCINGEKWQDKSVEYLNRYAEEVKNRYKGEIVKVDRIMQWVTVNRKLEKT